MRRINWGQPRASGIDGLCRPRLLIKVDLVERPGATVTLTTATKVRRRRVSRREPAQIVGLEAKLLGFEQLAGRGRSLDAPRKPITLSNSSRPGIECV